MVSEVLGLETECSVSPILIYSLHKKKQPTLVRWADAFHRHH